MTIARPFCGTMPRSWRSAGISGTDFQVLRNPEASGGGQKSRDGRNDSETVRGRGIRVSTAEPRPSPMGRVGISGISARREQEEEQSWRKLSRFV